MGNPKHFVDKSKKIVHKSQKNRPQIQKKSSTNPKNFVVKSKKFRQQIQKKIVEKSRKFCRQIQKKSSTNPKKNPPETQKKSSRNPQIQKSKKSYFLENPVILKPAYLRQLF